MSFRLTALLICLSAATGIGFELANLTGQGISAITAIWRLAGFFTILTNALVATVFAFLALRGASFDRPQLVAGVVAAIALVGVVYATLLTGLRPLGGATAVANFLLHQLNPIACVAFWLIFIRKGALSWHDPFLWALYPLAYLPYALARGMAEGHFAYPFIDVVELGWFAVGINVIVIAGGFVLAGELFVLIDRLISGRTGATPTGTTRQS